MLLSIKDGSVSLGGAPVLSSFDFEIREQDRAGIVGPNGAGKSTLLAVLAGKIPLDRDDRALSRGNGRLIRSRQFTVGLLGQFSALDPSSTGQTLLEEMFCSGTAGFSPDYSGAGAMRIRAGQIEKGLGIPAEIMRREIRTLSGGEQRKVGLLLLLLQAPDVLLLDEPTNALDTSSVEWLEGFVRKYPGAVVTVSHDRWFLDRTSTSIWEIAGGHLTRYAGNYTAYREERERRAAAASKHREAAARERAHNEELVHKFQGNRKKTAFVRARQRAIEEEKKETDVPFIPTIRPAPIVPARPGSKWVLTAEHLATGYTSVQHEISLRLRRGKKIGIIGPNGAGKTTFLKTIAGELPPLAGKLSIGQTVDPAYFDQDSAAIRSELSVFDWYQERFPSLTGKEIRSELAGFLFRGDDLGKTVDSLSGGERSRLVIASLLHTGPNLLLLDEPTNNMDIPARETLEALFSAYTGTILFVSHDRYFTDRVADALLIFDAGAVPVRYYPFGYAHYISHRDDRNGSAERSAEDEKLIEGLQNVPKASHLPHALSERAEETDYAFRMIRERKEAAEEQLSAADTEAPQYISLEDWLNAPEDEDDGKREQAMEELTESLVDWYDAWLDTPEGRREMQDSKPSWKGTAAAPETTDHTEKSGDTPQDAL